MARKQPGLKLPTLPTSWTSLGFTSRGGLTQLLTPTGAISLKKLGAGAFANVFEEVGGKGRVFAVVGEGTADKEIMANAHAAKPRNPHLPKVKGFGMLNLGGVYEMPKYDAPLRAPNRTAWRDYQALSTCHRKAFEAEYPKQRQHRTRSYLWAYQVNSGTVACARTKSRQKKLTPAVATALATVVDEATNYGSQMALEFSPRNLATDKKGRLILLDPVFDEEVMWRHRQAALQKARGY